MNVAGAIIAAIAAFAVLAFYLHEVTYRLGLRHGRQKNALELRHAQEEASEAKSREEQWRVLSEKWRALAIVNEEIADRARVAAGLRDDADDVGVASDAARASATMIGLRAASGARDLSGDIDALAEMCAIRDEGEPEAGRPKINHKKGKRTR